MSHNVQAFPLSLLLLIHLQILQYPQVNEAYFDMNIFDVRVRGLKDRTKSMEDISYFLVGRLEGSKVNARKILSTYPCLKPSDSTAFRTSLAKYLESIRYQALQGNLKGSKMPARGGSESGTSSSSIPAASYWWKDVIVRKSLLDECSGEKFLRMLVAFSTHALSRRSIRINVDDIPAHMRSQPLLYNTRLFSAQSAKFRWTHSAKLLSQKEERLRTLQAQLSTSHPSSKPTSKFASLSTQRLLALCDSSLEDLRPYWQGKDGEKALKALLKLAGLEADIVSASLSSGAPAEPSDQTEAPSTPPPSLLVAAAHHPSHLRRLSRSIFSEKKTKSLSVYPDTGTVSYLSQSTSSAAEAALSGRLQAEKRMQVALRECLAHLEIVYAKLEKRTRIAEMRSTVKARATLNLRLWEAGSHEIFKLNFEPQPTAELLKSLNLLSSQRDDMNTRITRIRAQISERCQLDTKSASQLPKAPRIAAKTATSAMTTKVPVRQNNTQKSSAIGNSLTLVLEPSVGDVEACLPLTPRKQVQARNRQRQSRFSLATKDQGHFPSLASPSVSFAGTNIDSDED